MYAAALNEKSHHYNLILKNAGFLFPKLHFVGVPLPDRPEAVPSLGLPGFGLTASMFMWQNDWLSFPLRCLQHLL